jgi:hypothetical protein
VTFIFVAAGCTFPDVFVGDGVGVFCCYFDVSVGEVVRAFVGPGSISMLLPIFVSCD